MDGLLHIADEVGSAEVDIDKAAMDASRDSCCGSDHVSDDLVSNTDTLLASGRQSRRKPGVYTQQ